MTLCRFQVRLVLARETVQYAWRPELPALVVLLLLPLVVHMLPTVFHPVVHMLLTEFYLVKEIFIVIALVAHGLPV